MRKYRVAKKNSGKNNNFDRKSNSAEPKQSGRTANGDVLHSSYSTPEQFKKAVSEKYNGITSTDKIKTANDVSDYLNYYMQTQYFASAQSETGQRVYKSTYIQYLQTSQEIPHCQSLFEDGTSVISIPKKIYNDSAFQEAKKELQKVGIHIGVWFDDTYQVTRKKGVRASKWISGIEKFNTE